jgi:hypothetical protein
LTAALANYWQHDALLQLLLHAVRVLLLHGPAKPMQPQEGQASAVAAASSAADEGHQVSVDEQQQQAQRAVGLPELLDAVQQLSKVRTWGWG